MRIGIDFDNTIANYDTVFHTAAMERGLIPTSLATSKDAVRDHLIRRGREAAFTELQGYVYGARMDLVLPYPGVAEFVAAARGAGHHVYVISHKTRRPIRGPGYDLHAAARDFLEANGFVSETMIAPERTFFEATKEEKVARTAGLALDVFIDDLPQILTMAGFSDGLRRILFDPHDAFASHAEACGLERHRDWPAIQDVVLR